MIAFLLPRLHRPSLLIPLFLCLGVNLTLLAIIAANCPEYLRDYRLNPNPDATDYVLLGRNIILHGEFSRSNGPPFVPDVLRTPLYPLFAGALEVEGGAGLLYAAQIVLHLGIVLLIYLLTDCLFGLPSPPVLGGRGVGGEGGGTSRLPDASPSAPTPLPPSTGGEGRKMTAARIGERPACVAALFAALHPTLLTLNFQAMAEMLFLFCLLLSLLPLFLQLARTESRRLAPYLVSGIWLGISILVRPAGLYLPVLIALYVCIQVAMSHRWVCAAKQALIFLAAAFACVVPWIVRNQVVFEIPHLTTADAMLLVYFTGAGAYEIKHNVDGPAAQRMIAKEFGLKPAEQMFNYQHLGLWPTDMDRDTRKAVPKVLAKYPVELIASSLLGVVHAYFSHDADFWATASNSTWIKPNREGLLRLRADSWSRLFSNPPFLTMMFFAQFLMNTALVALAGCGIVRALWRREDLGRVCLMLAIFIFFVLVCGANGCDAYTRFAAPSLIFAFVFAGACFVPRTARKTILD